MNPRTEALAYRIHCYCEPIGWDCTMTEVAEALDVSMPRVRQVTARKGWNGRFRMTGAGFFTLRGDISREVQGAEEEAMREHMKHETDGRATE